jgi:pimeloyl-ACP methyl ester carboxylesterase
LIGRRPPLTEGAVDWRSEHLRIGDMQLHLLQGGVASGALLVFVHGGSAHGRWWDYVAPLLAARFRLLSVDLRGHGDSRHVVPAAYRIADYVGDLAALARHLQTPFHLIGHSLGGMVAGAFAVAHRQHLRSLVVVDAQLRFSAASVRYLQRLASLPQLAYPDLATAVARYRVLPTQTNAPRPVIEHMAQHAFVRRDNGSWVLKFDRATLSQLEATDLVPSLQLLRVPMLLVRGAHSTVVSHERLAALRDLLPQMRTAEIADAHHHVMLDNPVGLAAALAAFLP